MGTCKLRGAAASLVAGVALAALAAAAAADFKVRGPDGRLILLKDDHTWEYVNGQGGAPEEHVLLSVERVEAGASSCLIGLRLVNNLRHPVRSLVPQFSAYKAGQIKIETVFQSFARIKPTRDQYQEIRFTGIGCPEIAYVKVHGADRCSMGDLTKFSVTKGECLKHIRLAPTDLINITK